MRRYVRLGRPRRRNRRRRMTSNRILLAILRQVNGSWVEITTPYLDRHNDALQIYVRRENDGFVLTDDSYIVHDLESSGCKLDTEKRKDLLGMTLKGFGVKLNGEAIEV